MQLVRLTDHIHDIEIIETDFSYGDVAGKAEMIGWQIISFSSGSSSEVSAINFTDMFTHAFLPEIGNRLLDAMQLSFRFSDNWEDIRQLYGKPDYTDTLLIDCTRYIYLLNDSKQLLCFGISDSNRLCAFEIISDQQIIINRINIYK